MTGRVFFEKYPKLLLFMLRELQSFIDEKDSPIRPSVQSILLLLSRLYVSNNCDNPEGNWKNDEFIILVSACAKSRIYKTRELAARAVIPLLTEKTVRSFINELFKKINCKKNKNNSSRWNIIHGYLLQALELAKSNLLHNCKLSKVHIDEFIDASAWIIDNLSVDNDKSACYPIAAAYVEFLHEFLKLYFLETEDPLFPYFTYAKVISTSMSYIIDSEKMKNRPGKEMYEESVVKLIIYWGLMGINSGGDISRTEEFLSSFWYALLNHNNDQIRILGFESIRETIAETVLEEAEEPIMNHALESAFKTLKQKNNCNPELYDAIYGFLADFFDTVGTSIEVENSDMGGQIKGPYHLYNPEQLAKSANFMDNIQRESPNFLKLITNVTSTSHIFNENEVNI